MAFSISTLEELLCKTSRQLWPDLSAESIRSACRLVPTLELEFGDLHTLLCLRLAKDLRSSPQELANKLVQSLPPQFEVSFSTLNGYLNFRIPDAELITMQDGQGQGVSSQSLALHFRAPGWFANLKSWAAFCVQVSSSSAFAAKCLVEIDGRTYKLKNDPTTFASVMYEGIQALRHQCPATENNIEWQNRIAKLSNAETAALVYYLLTINSEAELDWSVVKLGEKANLAWYLFCTLQRIAELGIPNLEMQDAKVTECFPDQKLREIYLRVKLLGRFFELASEGEVRPYALALSGLLSNVNALINSPKFRHRLRTGHLSAIEQTILAGINTVLSAMINKCSVLYLCRGLPGAAQPGLITDEVVD